MWRSICSLQTSGTRQNENFAQKYFSKSAGRVMPKVNLLASILYHKPPLGNLSLSVRGKMSYDRSGAINTFMHFSHFALFCRPWRKWVPTKQKKCCLSDEKWPPPTWYPLLLEMSLIRSMLLPRNISLKNPKGEVHSLIANRTLQLAVWTTSGKDYLRKRVQKQLLTYYKYKTKMFRVKLQFVLENVRLLVW